MNPAGQVIEASQLFNSAQVPFCFSFNFVLFAKLIIPLNYLLKYEL